MTKFKRSFRELTAVGVVAAIMALGGVGIVFSGNEYGPVTFMSDVSVGTWTSFPFAVTSTNLGSYTNGLVTNYYRMSGTTRLGRVTLSTNAIVLRGLVAASNACTLAWARTNAEGFARIVIEFSQNGAVWTNWRTVSSSTTNWLDRGTNTWTNSIFTNLFTTLIPTSSSAWASTTTVALLLTYTNAEVGPTDATGKIDRTSNGWKYYYPAVPVITNTPGLYFTNVFTGPDTFWGTMIVPYPAGTNQAANGQYVLDQVNETNLPRLNYTNAFTGPNTFWGTVIVPYPVATNHPLILSYLNQNAIEIPEPTATNHPTTEHWVVGYVSTNAQSLTNYATLTGENNFSGTNNFLVLVTVPYPTGTNTPLNLAYLNQTLIAVPWPTQTNNPLVLAYLNQVEVAVPNPSVTNSIANKFYVDAQITNVQGQVTALSNGVDVLNGQSNLAVAAQATADWASNTAVCASNAANDASNIAVWASNTVVGVSNLAYDTATYTNLGVLAPDATGSVARSANGWDIAFPSAGGTTTNTPGLNYTNTFTGPSNTFQAVVVQVATNVSPGLLVSAGGTAVNQVMFQITNSVTGTGVLVVTRSGKVSAAGDVSGASLTTSNDITTSGGNVYTPVGKSIFAGDVFGAGYHYALTTRSGQYMGLMVNSNALRNIVIFDGRNALSAPTGVHTNMSQNPTTFWHSRTHTTNANNEYGYAFHDSNGLVFATANFAGTGSNAATRPQYIGYSIGYHEAGYVLDMKHESNGVYSMRSVFTNSGPPTAAGWAGIWAMYTNSETRLWGQDDDGTMYCFQDMRERIVTLEANTNDLYTRVVALEAATNELHTQVTNLKTYTNVSYVQETTYTGWVVRVADGWEIHFPQGILP